MSALAFLAVIGGISFAFLGVYVGGEMSEQDIHAQGYIKKVVRSFNAEDLSEFRQYLHPQLAGYLDSDEGVKLVSILGAVGELKSIEESKWVSSKNAVSTSKGAYEFSNYEVNATFEQGKGLIKVTTIPNGDGYLVTNFQIFSKYYSTLNITKLTENGSM